MKKLFFLFAMMVAMVANGQDIQLTPNGAYEVKEVVSDSTVSKNTFFGRAMEALSDWTGDDGKSCAGIDYSDKEAGTVIYKGEYYMGYYKTSLGGYIDAYINFTLKVRCKDGKAQTTVSTSSVTYKASGIPSRTASIREILEKKKEGKQPNERQKKRIHMTPVRECVQNILKAMTVRLAIPPDNDDF